MYTHTVIFQDKRRRQTCMYTNRVELSDCCVIFCVHLVESWQDKLVSPQEKLVSTVESTVISSPVETDINLIDH